MQWFRDYIYIPFGGNRRGKTRTLINIAVVFLISGLWHGAAFNFIAWGAYWAIIYIAARLLPGIKRYDNDISPRDLPKIALTLGFVMFGFFIFRCDTMEQFISGIKALWAYVAFFGLVSLILEVLCRWRGIRIVAIVISVIALLYILCHLLPHWLYMLKAWWFVPFAIVAASEWRCRNLDYPMQSVSSVRWKRLLLYWAMIASVLISEPLDMTFIYFRF